MWTVDSIFKKMGSEGWESRRVWLQRPGNCEQERARPASAHINLGLRGIDAWEYRTPGWLWEPKGWLFLTIVNLESQGCDLLSDNHQRPRKRTESGNWFKKKGKKLLSLCTVVFPLPFTKSNAETKTLTNYSIFIPLASCFPYVDRIVLARTTQTISVGKGSINTREQPT